MITLMKSVGEWLSGASDMTLLLVFLCLSSGTIAAVTVFLLRRHLPKKWRGAKDENDAPLLSRDWFKKVEERGEKLHAISNKVGGLEMARPKWDDAAVAAESHAREIGLLRTKLEQVSQRTHEFSGRVGEIKQLSERVDSLEQRHEGHMTESLKQTGQITAELSEVKVGVARLEEQMKGVKDSSQRIERNVDKLADRFFGPSTPAPRRRMDDPRRDEEEQ